MPEAVELDRAEVRGAFGILPEVDASDFGRRLHDLLPLGGRPVADDVDTTLCDVVALHRAAWTRLAGSGPSSVNVLESFAHQQRETADRSEVWAEVGTDPFECPASEMPRLVRESLYLAARDGRTLSACSRFGAAISQLGFGEVASDLKRALDNPDASSVFGDVANKIRQTASAEIVPVDGVDVGTSLTAEGLRKQIHRYGPAVLSGHMFGRMALREFASGAWEEFNREQIAHPPIEYPRFAELTAEALVGAALPQGGDWIVEYRAGDYRVC